MSFPPLGLLANLRIYLAVEPVDMRKQYDGLWALAEQHLRLDPFGGALFVFTNKTRDRIKLLHWDGTGVWVLAKRLEKGRFSWPVSADGSARRVDLEPAALSMLLAGIDLKDGAKKAWYERGQGWTSAYPFMPYAGVMPPLADLPAAYLALERENDELKSANALMNRQIEKLQKQIFGPSKSEKLDRAQLLFQLKELEAMAEKAARPARVIEPEEVKAEPEAYERIGEERTFEVEITPPRLSKREIVRPKYKAKADRSQAPVLAPAPARAVPGGYASAGLLAWVVIAKYLDHLPLHRQEQMLARWGAAIPRSTLCEWIRIAADWLEPIYKAMLRRLLEGDYLQADETPIKCQDPDNAKAGVFQGYLWVVSRPGDDVCFDWRTSRRHGELTSLIEGFGGVLQSDGYEAYAAYERAHPEVAWVGCWAHARRKFIEAQGENPKAARVVLKLIGRLYRMEREWD